jgi:hypothetical protein
MSLIEKGVHFGAEFGLAKYNHASACEVEGGRRARVDAPKRNRRRSCNRLLWRDDGRVVWRSPTRVHTDGYTRQIDVRRRTLVTTCVGAWRLWT